MDVVVYPRKFLGKRLPRNCVGKGLFFMFWGLSFSIAFDMGCVWNVYEVGMAYALILHELCQKYVWNIRECAGNWEGNMYGVWMEYAWSHFSKIL